MNEFEYKQKYTSTLFYNKKIIFLFNKAMFEYSIRVAFSRIFNVCSIPFLRCAVKTRILIDCVLNIKKPKSSPYEA